MEIQHESGDASENQIGERLLSVTLAELRGAEPRKGLRDKTMADLEWGQLIEMIIKHSVSPEGFEVCASMGPLPNAELATRRMTEIMEAVTLIDEEGDLPLRGLKDMRMALAMSIRGGMLMGTDLEIIARNCDVASRTRRFLKHRTEFAPNLALVGAALDACRDLRDVLDRAVEPGGRLADAASPDLRRLRRAVQNQTERIKARVEKLLRSDTIEHMLQDDFFTVRDDRYVLPIRVSNKRELDGIVHGYSSSGQTAFIEPQELIELNNQLRWSQIEVQDEERRILQRLTTMVSEHAPALRLNLEILAYLDFVSACGQFSIRLDAHPVSFSDTVDLQRLRHPMLSAKLAHEDGNDTVPNDVAFQNQVLVISGPNTGGKTVLVKAVGLAAAMARCGLPITAEEGSKLPFFGAIYTDIGDEQSIELDLSTFSSHMVNINGFLPECGPKSLVLLDELFNGTDPKQGSALGAALLEKLADAMSTVMVTTHLEGLKTLGIQDERFTNASMGFNVDSLEPTYQIILGLPGSSYALRIAKRLGFPDELIERATLILKDEGGYSLDQTLSNLEEQVEALNTERQRYETLRGDADKLKRRYDEKLKKVSQKERGLVTEDAQQLKAQLSEVREVLRTQIAEMTAKNHTITRKDVDRIGQHVRKAEETVDKVRARSEEVTSTDSGHVQIETADLEEGMDVFVPKYGKKGVLIEYRVGAKEGKVQLGVMKTHIAVEQLCYPSETQRKRHHVGKKSVPEPSTDNVALQTQSNTLDLRGQRVEEGVDRVDIFLDSAFLKQEVAVFIIHGHGTGALRRGVRDYLADSRYVREFRRGGRTEGGDGVTVAYLNAQV